MSRITTCPQCQTRFRVTDEQLQARNGKVRCGRCEHIFNALETLNGESSPPVVNMQPPELQSDAEGFSIRDASISPEPENRQQEASPTETSDIPEQLFDLEITHPETEASRFEPDQRQPDASLDEIDLPQKETSKSSHFDETVPSDEIAENAFDALDKLVPPEPEPESKTEVRVVRIQPPPVVIQPKVSPASPKYAPPPKPRRTWPWAMANLLLLAGLAGQGMYFYRDAIAAHYPPTRHLLEQACIPLQCSISLPRNPDLISIESSELNADPARANIVVLTSMLRNRAPHVQAYPTLELTLTSAKDEMVARILFTPREYLRNPAAISQGIPASGEVAVKLLMDLGGLKAEGYRLYLFYPSQL